MSDTAGTIGRALLILFLIIATLGFGMMGLCGAGFTVMMASEAAGALILSVPCLLIGFGMAWWCGRQLARVLSRKS